MRRRVDAAPRTPPIDSTVFKLAAGHGGRLTLSQIVIETGLTLAQAESAMEKLVDGMRVRMEVDKNGLVHYEFPELRAE
jgi:hypothetical protein